MVSQRLIQFSEIPYRRSFYGVLGIGLLFYLHYYGNATRGYYDTGSVYVWWFSQWFDAASDLQHSPFLLLFVIGFAGYRWKKLESEKSEAEDLWGFLWVATGLFLNSFGYFAQQTRINCVAVLSILFGVSLWLGGRRVGKAVAFPLVLMIFTLPFQFLQDVVGYWLRSGVITLSGETLKLFGIAIEQSGTILQGEGGRFVYDVAPACSGMRSLLILTALSLIIGGIVFKSAWRRMVLLGVALPLAFLGNWVRVLMILLAGHWFGQEAGMWVHETMGFVVFVVVVGGALATTSLLEKLFPEPDEWNGGWKFTDRKWAKWGSFGVACGALLGGLYLFVLSFQLDRVDMGTGIYLDESGQHPRDLPSVIAGEWVGESQEISPAERSILPGDTGFARKLYSNWGGDSVLFSVLLSGRDRSSIHRPEICLVAQGFTIQAKWEDQVVVAEERSIPVTLMQVEQKGRDDGRSWRGLFAYCFVSERGIYGTHLDRMIAGFWDRLRGRPARWGYVLVQLPITDSMEKTQENLESFLPLIWTEVVKLNDEEVSKMFP